jgi:hypothetical protein
LTKNTRISCLLLTCSIGFSAFLAADPLPYTASYRASYEFLSASAERSLQILENGHYRLENSLEVKIAGTELLGIRESSEFLWQQNALTPLTYSYQQSGIRSKRETVGFDWQQLLATSKEDEKSWELQIAPGVYDKLSYQLVIQQTLLDSASAELNFQLIDTDEIEFQSYRVLGNEIIDTPMGQLQTLHVERQLEADSKRHTSFWLASDWNFLLVRLLHTDNSGSEMELLLEKAVIDDREIQPIR